MSPDAAISEVSAAWQDGGLSAPVAASPYSAVACCIEGCAAMTFVELRTPSGTRSLCFKHFEWVQQDLHNLEA